MQGGGPECLEQLQAGSGHLVLPAVPSRGSAPATSGSSLREEFPFTAGDERPRLGNSAGSVLEVSFLSSDYVKCDASAVGSERPHTRCGVSAPRLWFGRSFYGSELSTLRETCSEMSAATEAFSPAKMICYCSDCPSAAGYSLWRRGRFHVDEAD
jgi:hypothetical protein